MFHAEKIQATWERSDVPLTCIGAFNLNSEKGPAKLGKRGALQGMTSLKKFLARDSKGGKKQNRKVTVKLGDVKEKGKPVRKQKKKVW